MIQKVLEILSFNIHLTFEICHLKLIYFQVCFICLKQASCHKETEIKR